jgi:hypothetical protein
MSKVRLSLSTSYDTISNIEMKTRGVMVMLYHRRT